MSEVIRIGIDTSKSVFVLHGVDEGELRIVREKLRRREVGAFLAKLAPTRIGIEACGAAHYWGRTIAALGHEVVLLPPQLVKPYVARNKNDRADAEAICEAMSRPRMRFVAVKTAERQAAQMLIGLRDRLVRQRTQLSNAIRGYAAEFGLVAARGLDKIDPLLARVADDPALPQLAKQLFALHGQEYAQLMARLRQVEAELMAWHRNDELSRRLAAIPGVGPIGACALSIKVTDPHAFRCGRDFAAWMGLTPKDHSTAGRQRLGAITRAGDETLRSLMVVGATAVIQQARRRRDRASPWLLDILARKPPKLAAVALANKTARIAWKLMVSGERYDPHRASPGRGAPSSPPAGRVAPCSRRQGRSAPPAAVPCGQP
jgi:transposase